MAQTRDELETLKSQLFAKISEVLNDEANTLPDLREKKPKETPAEGRLDIDPADGGRGNQARGSLSLRARPRRSARGASTVAIV